MYKKICISNRLLCNSDFLKKLEEISNMNIPIILREKDLSELEYEELAKKVIEHCNNVVLHSFTDVARRLNYKKIHLPLNILKKENISDFDIVGASTHSVDDAVLAEQLGASYITAGHIFKTDCKKGLEPRGLEFLQEVCNSVNIPVYAIGGINDDNIEDVINCGASGVCIMSGFMRI